MRLAISAAIAFAGLAQVACAGDAFDAFDNICVGSQADMTQALASADRSGWMPMPQTLLGKFQSHGIFDQVDGRIRSNNNAIYMLFAGSGHPAFLPGADAHVCAVAELPADRVDFEQEAASFAAVPSDPAFNGNVTDPATHRTTYAWREEDGKHIPIKRDDPDFMSFLQSGSLRFLMTQSDDKVSMIVFLVAAKQASKPN